MTVSVHYLSLNHPPMHYNALQCIQIHQNALNCVTLKKLCWTAVAKPDLLGHFSQLFWGKHDCLSTLPHPQPPTNALQCTAMHPNSPKYTDLCHWCFWCILVNLDALQCIVVHWWGGWGWGSVLRQSCFPQNSWEKWPRQIRFGHSGPTIFFKVTQCNAFWWISMHCSAL